MGGGIRVAGVEDDFPGAVRLLAPYRDVVSRGDFGAAVAHAMGGPPAPGGPEFSAPADLRAERLPLQAESRIRECRSHMRTDGAVAGDELSAFSHLTSVGSEMFGPG